MLQPPAAKYRLFSTKLVGVRREVINLIQRVLPIMNHYISTEFRISKNSYGNNNYKLGGTS